MQPGNLYIFRSRRRANPWSHFDSEPSSVHNSPATSPPDSRNSSMPISSSTSRASLASSMSTPTPASASGATRSSSPRSSTRTSTSISERLVNVSSASASAPAPAPANTASTPPPPAYSPISQLFAPPMQAPASLFTRAELRNLNVVDDARGSPVTIPLEIGQCLARAAMSVRQAHAEAEAVESICSDMSLSRINSSVLHPLLRQADAGKVEAGKEEECWDDGSDGEHRPTAQRTIGRSRGASVDETLIDSDVESQSVVPISTDQFTRPDFVEEKSLVDVSKQIEEQIEEEIGAIAKLNMHNSQADHEILWLTDLKHENEKEKVERLDKILELHGKRYWSEVRIQIVNAETEAEGRWIMLKSYLGDDSVALLVLTTVVGWRKDGRKALHDPLSKSHISIAVCCLMVLIAAANKWVW